MKALTVRGVFMQQLWGIFSESLLSFSFLSLATLGIVLIFKTSSTTNFAQGMLGILGAYVTSYLIDSQGIVDLTGKPSVVIDSISQLILPIAGGMLTSFLFGYLIEVLIFRQAKQVNAVTKQIITMGLVLIITGLIPIVFGITRRASFKFSDATVVVWGASLPVHRLVTLGLATTIIGTIFILLRFTKWGLAVRSVASNERVASLMGVNTNRISAMSWALAGGLGALSAITYTAAVSSLTIAAMTDIQLNAFYASVLGGFSTFYGPLVGVFVMMFGQSAIPKILIKYNLAPWSKVILYLLIMLVILIKPNGLFGKKSEKKV